MSLVAVVVTGMTTPAEAANPPSLAIAGDPTEEEARIVSTQWGRFVDYFIPDWECLGTIEVNVVARVEDYYGGAAFGPIASFYRVSPRPAVFIEHGKVTVENLLHEFAHHLDLSCDIGGGQFAVMFRRAQGLPEDQPWLSGSSWDTVPAEHFAQATLVAFGLPSTKIAIAREAASLIVRRSQSPRGLVSFESINTRRYRFGPL
jgi:hypothetical protein